MSLKKLKGPKYPKFIQSWKFVKNPYAYLDRCKELYGDPFLLYNRIPVFSEPKALKQIFSLSPDKITNSASNFGLDIIFGKKSMLLNHGTYHIYLRNSVSPFLKNKTISQYEEIVHKTCLEIIEDWPHNKNFNIHLQMQKISLNIILKIIFGFEDENKRREFSKDILTFLSIFNGLGALYLFLPFTRKNLGPLTSWQKYLQQLQKINQTIYSEIEIRKKIDQKGDVFSLLLKTKNEEGQILRDEEIRDQLMTLLVAGYETTASSLAWCFYCLYNSPKVLQKLLAELEPFRKDFKISEIVKLEFLEAVCKETLRLYPVVSEVARCIRTPLEIMDYKLNPGEILYVNIYLAHRREETYKNPDVFYPERFIENTYSPYEFLPFGGGIRKCIGANFALYEMKIVIATILLKYSSLRLVEKNVVPIVNSAAIVSPANGIRFHL